MKRHFTRDIPLEVEVPEDIAAMPPAPDLPDHVKAFFGKNGKWWGSWKSRQARGTFDAVLIVKSIENEGEARVIYLTPEYPRWYIPKGMWEAPARFYRKENGRVVLSLPYEPFGVPLECWFEVNVFKGSALMRFMRADILWKPLP